MTKQSYRTRQLRAQLAEAQHKLRTEPHRKVELEIERLEQLLEAAERNDVARAKRMARLAEAENAKTEAYQAQQRATVEAQLRQEYNRALSTPVTDAEWDMVKADVFHQHRLRTMGRTDELVKQAAARYRI